jgi:DNA ligase-1
MSEQKPSVFKRASSGKIQLWNAKIVGDRYQTCAGQMGGKMTISSWTVCKPKNVGKANETSGEAQVILEVDAMYAKQIKKGYFYDISQVDQRQGVEPMLAAKWKDRLRFFKKEGVTHVAIQPKLDGARCIVTKDGCFSRTKEEFLSVPHISEILAPLFEKYPDLILDGELYNHDYRDNFNKIMSLIKKKTPTKEELAESAEKVQFWIYDIPSETTEFEERWYFLTKLLMDNFEYYDFGIINDGAIALTDTIFNIPIEDVGMHGAKALEAGYEGIMARLMNGLYEFKRSNSLMKWKEFQDNEFIVVDVVDGKGNRSGIAASVICALPDGRTFGSGPLGTLEYCKELFENKDEIIGKMGTVKFQDYTPDGIPRFSKFKGIRDYE